ncbi:N-acetyl-gamma-glutamyl-phosphate reductase [Arenimonas caeni]|uniref:N-acetyl-gamma-glutamyl-phosphate reductase n=1 Tax=Arenimonas caeni TaxID=2058085 RepID=A0A2P6M6F1_9GAMM|nr:N-acetyl-gamma-glutamyl-phosphate reductase [Arenimonas caeni]MDY0022808.1 N-acetyl-gamma-glutamyl-phosphate reductase [Arenimonas caeni]PRH81587.1 N-acetyl-gamma-glutamyl-phosphate reductase [Arenimonas caeni]
MAERISLGLVGARGYVGAELIRLVAAHPRFALAFVSSRERDGQRLADHEPAYAGDLRYTNLGPEAVAGQGVDALVLALPNGMAAGFVAALDWVAADPVVVDLSADYRFDDSWHYGLPELTRARAAGARRISNPGCYATAMQLAVAPMRDALAGPVQCFGVSGYSGAGTSPSDKNDPEKLRDNLMPYALAGHIHEREVTRQLGHPVEFMPHVAPHFRGITLTANLHLARSFSRDEVVQRYREAYAGEPLVAVSDEAPWVSRIAGRHGVEVGGFTLADDGRRLVVVSTLDNLLKGAATQALQNLNLAFGLPETMGIPT